MSAETDKILTQVISDVGFWQWWDGQEGDFMVEFGGVLLYDESKKGKKARSSLIALCFYGDSFIIFLDNLDTGTSWYIDLHEDNMEPLTLDHDGFRLNDKEYALKLLNDFSRRQGVFDSKEEAVKAITDSSEIIAATAGDYGFIIGGNTKTVFGRKGEYSDEDIVRLSKKWWEYWEDYWNKRDTKDAYETDYACEVTIPMK